MKKLTLGLLLLQCVFAWSQELAFDKIICSLGSGNISTKEIVTDKAGDLYLLGQFNGTLQLEQSSLTAKGKNDLFLARYDKYCKLIWLKHFSGSGNINAHSVITDGFGNIYFSGNFSQSCFFGDKKLKAMGYQNNFIAKLSKKGDIIWLKQIKAETKSYKTVLAAGTNGQLFYAGSFMKKMAFDTINLMAENGIDIFVSELDENGNFVRAITISGQQIEELKDLKVTQNNEIFLTGLFEKDIRFGNQSFESKGQEDIFIAKYKDLKLEWASTAGGVFSDYGTVLKIKDENIILGGVFSDEVDFGKDKLNSKGVLDVFTGNYSKDGQLNWVTSYGSAANEYLNALEISNNGQLYLCGNFRGEIKKDQNEIKSDGMINDLFMAKLSGEGDFIWAQNYGGKGADYAVDLVENTDNYLYLTGEFDESITFLDKEIKSGTGKNLFVSRFFDCYQNKKINLGDNISICGSQYILKAEDGFTAYQWSNGVNEMTNQVNASGTYSIVATDSLGCKSTDELTLILNPLPELEPRTDYILCQGGSVRLDAGQGYKDYLWYNNSKNRKITVTEAGEYFVEVSNANDCKVTDTLIVIEIEMPESLLGEDLKTERGTELKLGTEIKYNSYLWSDFSKASVLTIDTKEFNIGKQNIWLEAEDVFGCRYCDTVQIEVLEPGLNGSKEQELVANISPNPSNGRFELKLENIITDGPLDFKIYSGNGLLLKSIEGQKNTKSYYKCEIDLQELPQGIYFFKLKAGNQHTTKEIVIQ